MAWNRLGWSSLEWAWDGPGAPWNRLGWSGLESARSELY
jgi:hypothetical protein